MDGVSFKIGSAWPMQIPRPVGLPREEMMFPCLTKETLVERVQANRGVLKDQQAG